MPAYSRVTGGSRLKAHFARQRRAIDRLDNQKIIIGFEGFVSMVAMQLEFGVERPDSAGGNIPERPAFRGALSRISDAIRAELKNSAALQRADALERAGEAGRRALVGSYRSYRGPGLSARRTAAKAGTAGAGRELVGPEGEKLISHIMARVVKE